VPVPPDAIAHWLLVRPQLRAAAPLKQQETARRRISARVNVWARHAVGVEATLPNGSGWSRTTDRSLRQSAVGEHDRKIPQDLAGLVAVTTRRLPGRTPSQRPVQLCRSANSPSSATPAWPTTPVPLAVTWDRGRELVACTHEVPPWREDTAFTQPFSRNSGRGLADPGQSHHTLVKTAG